MMKAWLESSNTRQSAFADSVGISRGYFSCLVNGNKKPSIEIAMRISLLTGGSVGLDSWFTLREIADLGRGFKAAKAEPLKAVG